MNCDPVAPYYAAMEFAVFGRTLERCRFHFLPELSGARRALVLGDGDGRFLRRLLDACPGLRADYVDCSPAMLAKARRAVGERAAYYCMDALVEELPAANYDLVVTHFFLDCFDREDQAAMVGKIAAVAPGARWLVSEFRVPQNRWIEVPARALIGVMYRFFGLTTGLKTRALSDHRPLLQDVGFRMSSSAARASGFVVSELWAREPVE